MIRAGVVNPRWGVRVGSGVGPGVLAGLAGARLAPWVLYVVVPTDAGARWSLFRSSGGITLLSAGRTTAGSALFVQGSSGNEAPVTLQVAQSPVEPVVVCAIRVGSRMGLEVAGGGFVEGDVPPPASEPGRVSGSPAAVAWELWVGAEHDAGVRAGVMERLAAEYLVTAGG